MLHFPTGKRM